MSLFVEIEKDLGSFYLDVHLEAENETLALLGASGCGKTMTLKCIAGVERPDRGKIVLDGVTLFDSEKKINLPPQKRRTGLLFQNYALFPHMTVLQNLQAGAGRQRQAQIPAMLEQFGLTQLATHLPRHLSGGQQQRVALARLLASQPRLLLLDEPFSALDRHLRGQLEQELRAALRAFGKTVLLVSHDRNEVYRMADSIAILDGGHVEMQGTREQVFFHPKTRSAASLTGCGNISGIQAINGAVRACDWGLTLPVAAPPGAVAVAIRPQSLVPETGSSGFPCRVVEAVENPFSYTVLLRPVGADTATPLIWEVAKDTWQRLRGAEITICLPPEQLLFLN